MKILLTTFWTFPHVGGVSRHLQLLKKGLEELGHQVDILAQLPDGSGFYVTSSETETRVYKANISQVARQKIAEVLAQRFSSVNDLLVEQELERIGFELASIKLGIQHYDLIHAHDVISALAIARVKDKHIPLVLTLHGSIPYEHLTYHRTALPDHSDMWNYLLTRERISANYSEHIIVPSEWLKKILVQTCHISDQKIDIIPYGMDVNAFKQRVAHPVDVQIPSDKTVFLCPARLDVVKGHHILLEALAELKKIREDWLCLIVGDGYLREELEQKCQFFELQHLVQFLGFRRDIPELLNMSDIVVLPSLQDTHPFSIMEAQIMGKAIVCSDAGGLPEMVQHHQTGLLAPFGFAKPLCQHLLRLLQDESYRLQLGDNGRKHGEIRWRLDSMIQHVVHVYDRVLHGKNATVDNIQFVDGSRITLPKHFTWVDHQIANEINKANPVVKMRTKENQNQVNIAILGSCVTRDIFEYFPNQYQIGPVFSRTSVISLMTSPLPVSYQDINLKSEWQKRMVYADFQKSFWDSLQRYHIDLLIIDFIDERFDLCYSDGSYVTRSHEFVESGVEHLGQYNFQLINRFDSITTETWKWYCDLFIDRLSYYFSPNKILLHKAFWMPAYYRNGTVTEFDHQEWIAENNKLLKEYYAHFEKKWKGIHSIDLSQSGLLSCDKHRWGLQPYHYEDEYYMRAGTRIADILARGD